MPTLVAMARSGETFITRSDRDGLWLHMPSGAGGAGPINETTAHQAVADHGFTKVDRDFATWAELEDFRQQEAAKFAPPVEIDPADLDDEDVREMLEVARRWATEGETERSRRLLLKLLLVPVAVTDISLRRNLVAALESLGATGTVVNLRDDPTDPTMIDARRRLADVVAAA